MTWQKLLSREGVDITTISAIDCVFYEHIKEFKASDSEPFFTHFENKTFTHFIHVDPQELGRFLYKKYFNKPEQIMTYYKEGIKLLKEIKEAPRTFENFLAQFNKVNHVYSITSWLALEAWQHDFEQALNVMIKRSNANEEEIMSSVHEPWKRSAVHLIQEDIKAEISTKLIAEKYQYLRSWSVIWHRDIDEEWVKNIGAKPQQQEKRLTKEEIKNLLNPTKDEEHFLEMAPYLIFFKDWRDDLRRAHCYYWSDFFTNLAQEWSCERDDLGFLTINEIKNAIEQGNVDKEMITKRKKQACIITQKEEGLMHVTEYQEKYQKVREEIESKEKNITIKGLVAQKGKVQGKVKIVHSYHDLKNVEKGDILVANTTHPNYLPAMQRAAGFLTNEGGIISHAAIVAREMKKPCIVGTKVATKVLIDGDMIELNADSGEVKKL